MNINGVTCQPDELPTTVKSTFVLSFKRKFCKFNIISDAFNFSLQAEQNFSVASSVIYRIILDKRRMLGAVFSC